MPTQHAPLDDNTSLSPNPAPPFVLLTNQSVQEKINRLKTNKSSQPDCILRKLLKLVGKAIVPALVGHLQLQRRT